MKTRAMQSELGDNYIYYQEIKSMTQMMRTPQARLPYDVVIK
jgi:protease-4